MNNSEKHLPALDGVRGLAVLIVVALHTGGGAQSHNPIVRLIGTIIHTGWNGVTLFFVLSGFLITGILWDTRDAPNRLKNFYARRSLRIFPLYYATLLLVLLAAVLAHHGLYCLSKLWVYALYLQNIPALAPRILSLGSPLQLTHFWSLAVEEQFYLAWPFLLYRTRTLQQARSLCCSVFFLSAAFRLVVMAVAQDPPVYAEFILARAGELAAGGFLATCYRDESWKKVQAASPVVLFVCLGIFSIFAEAYYTHRIYMFEIGIPTATLVWSAFLALSLRPKSIIQTAINTAWLRWVGKISYGVYIFHVLLISRYARLVAFAFPHAGRNQALILSGLTNIVLSTLIAALSFKFFESPFLKLRSRFKAKAPVHA